MSVKTPVITVTLNAAFLQEIKDSNPDLVRTRQELRQCCRTNQPPSAVAGQLIRLLDELRDHLALQFALEEAYGFMEVHQSLANPAAAEAKRQHCGLYLEISELCERAEELQYRGLAVQQFGSIVRQLEQFDQRLRRHDQFEEKLIEQAADRHEGT